MFSVYPVNQSNWKQEPKPPKQHRSLKSTLHAIHEWFSDLIFYAYVSPDERRARRRAKYMQKVEQFNKEKSQPDWEYRQYKKQEAHNAMVEGTLNSIAWDTWNMHLHN